MPNLKHNVWNSRQNLPRKYIIFYAQKNFSKKLFFRLKKIAFCKKSLTCHLTREYAPLPHVFPPFAIRQSPTGRATLGSRTLGGVASLCHSLRWCKKITAHPQLRTLVWCSALPSSSPLLLAFRLRRSECLYKNAQNKQTANKKGTRLSAFFYL